MVTQTTSMTNVKTATMIDRLRKSKRKLDQDDSVRGAAAGKRWARERANDMQRRDIEELAQDEKRLFAPEVNRISKFFLFELMVNRDLATTPSLSRAELERAWFPPRGTRLSRAYVCAFVKSAYEHWHPVKKEVAK